jgi:3-phenylpropionate/trans-cinnamate dioxygenase ferredoxin reductase subunit
MQRQIEKEFDCIIVGAGHGGAQAAISLRQYAFAGSIAMIGAEPEPPYDRPSLSKDYLAGKKTFDRIQLRPAEFWASRDVVLHKGCRVTAVDAAGKAVTIDGGTRLGYRSLIWSAGGEPRRLTCEGSDLPGIFYIRSKADVDALREALFPKARVGIVGGGYVGLEAAAVLRELGNDVTLVEALDRVLARVAASPISRFYEEEHRRHGVDIRLNSSIGAFLSRNGRVAAMRLQTGEVIPTDLVIVGIGIVPTVLPLVAAGARGTDGVDVDEFCRTTLPDIYCIGDCARMPFGPGVRIESVQNASDQAMTAARAISGQPKAHHALPWFWSNQYDLKLQTVGLHVGYDATVLRGAAPTRSFSLIYLKNGAVRALDCINASRDYVQGRKLVEASAKVDPLLLADSSRTLAEILSQATAPADSAQKLG